LTDKLTKKGEKMKDKKYEERAIELLEKLERPKEKKAPIRPYSTPPE